MAYTLTIKFTDSTGKTSSAPLTGPQSVTLGAVASPLAVELIPANDTTYDLLVTAASNKKQGNISGTGAYEIFIDHRANSAIMDAAMANGPHFMVMNPVSNQMVATLAELPSKPGSPTRLHLSLAE